MNTNAKLKTERVEFRLAPNQKRALQKLADDARLSLTDYILSKLDLPLPTLD